MKLKAYETVLLVNKDRQMFCWTWAVQIMLPSDKWFCTWSSRCSHAKPVQSWNENKAVPSRAESCSIGGNALKQTVKLNFRFCPRTVMQSVAQQGAPLTPFEFVGLLSQTSSVSAALPRCMTAAALQHKVRGKRSQRFGVTLWVSDLETFSDCDYI